MTQRELTEEGHWLMLAAYWPEARGVVGDVILKWTSEQHRQGEIGYVFKPEFQGKGLTREAAEAVLRLGFEELGLYRIVADCDARNVPSWRLMERLGTRREAHYREFKNFDGEWCDLFVYALLKEEYERAAS
jgi:RimJ/RimL family protein N-acetyltransferase